jgi:aryl-alcohol dehydrogenase-like predicted oxidoreductase
MSNLSREDKSLVLGTALWGWGVDRNNAYELLEKFLNNGGSHIDTATNYPINKYKEDFGLAVKWIADWVSVNGSSKLALTVKIGSVDNMGTPDVNLAPSDIDRSANKLREKFGKALSCISVHWDNRTNHKNQTSSIEQTVNAMSTLESEGIAIGLSGIKHPELYYKANPALADRWIIQVKENFVTRYARESYQRWFPNAKYLAYGINLGGLKTEPAATDSSIELRQINIPKSTSEKLVCILNSSHHFEPRPASLNELALAAAFVNPALSGVIIGPRNLSQLESTLEYWHKLKSTSNKPKGLELFNQISEQIPQA